MTPDNELFFHRFAEVDGEVVAFISRRDGKALKISLCQIRQRIANLSAKGMDFRFSKGVLDGWPIGRDLVFLGAHAEPDKIPPLKPVQCDPEVLAISMGARSGIMVVERTKRVEKAKRDAMPEYPGVWPPPLLGFPRG